MNTMTMRLAAGLALAVTLSACGSASPAALTPAPPAASAPAGGGPIAGADPTPVPIGTAPSGPGTDPGGLVPGGPADSGSGSGSGGSGSSGGSGGVAPGDPGTGVVTSPPDGGGIVPDPPGTIVTPVAGLLNIRAIGATKLEPALNGTDIAVRISWVSGVEPCSVLAGVTVARDGNTFKLTVAEGSKGEGMACIEMAMFKATIVDLGKMDPGTYTITAFGDAPAVTVDVK
jgi:ABC-type transport system substrate-binding protein